MTDYLERLKRCNAELEALSEDRRGVAHMRQVCVRTLLLDGYSLQRIADEVGLSKSAIAKIAK